MDILAPRGTAVLAAGSWAGRIVGLPRALPVEPVHGQLIALDDLARIADADRAAIQMWQRLICAIQASFLGSF